MKSKFSLVFLFLIVLSTKSFASAWTAKWIESENCKSTVNTWQVFRKTVVLSAVPKSLMARISVDSKYWLWINGRMVVFEGGLKRGPSPSDSYYDVVNIRPYLHRGRNVIAILSLFYGKEGFSHKSSGQAALLFEAHSEHVDIVSDESWEATVYKAYGKVGNPEPNYRLCESNLCFDGRESLGDWYSPAFRGHFPKAKVFSAVAENGVFGKLVLRPIPLFRYSGLKKYVSQSFDPATRILHCRLPYDAQVTPYLKVKAPAGDTIDMRTEDYLVAGVPSVRGEYITCNGVQKYESLGWMNGNEVQYRIPENVKVLAVRYRESGYDTKIVGNFKCNDPFFTELWKRSARTLYVNMRDTYSDCPDRERAQWWGDVTNDIQENFYTLSPSSWQIINKGIYELMNWQRRDGTIFAPVPAGNWDKELPVQMLMSVGWYGFHKQYYDSGDSSFVSVIYDRLHRYLHDVWKMDNNGYAITREGGWSWADWGDHIDLSLLTAEWYYLALKGERDFARMLNREADVKADDVIMKRMKDHFDSCYWKGSDYRSDSYKEMDSDDRAQAMAVLSGLADPDKYPEIIRILKKSYFASPLMEMYVQRALFKMGQGEFALQRAKEKYVKMMSYKDQTTVFEFWDKGGSINHAWASGMTVIFGQEVCGVRPTSPGFKTFEVKPDLAGLSQVSANMQTLYGMIRIRIKKKNGYIHLTLTVPEGTQATVMLGREVQRLKAGKYHLSSKE
jgi:hypothetical protein